MVQVLEARHWFQQNKFFKKYSKTSNLFLENVDEISITGLLSQLKMERTYVVVISKSGETIEIIIIFF